MNAQELLTQYNAGARAFAGVYLSGAVLRGANLSAANLSDTNLSGADLRGADLRGANLSYANLSYADLRGADLRGASLCYANLCDANLSGANLRGANLSVANLRDANLSVADLRGANLSGATLCYANLSGAEGLEQQCITPEGALVVWKKVSNGLAKLRIPAAARRVNAYGSRKCRAEYAVVLEAPEDAVSLYNGVTTYRVGRRVRADGFCDDPRIECSQGIHFFLTRAEAEAY
jgi:hypothetical protein